MKAPISNPRRPALSNAGNSVAATATAIVLTLTMLVGCGAGSARNSEPTVMSNGGEQAMQAGMHAYARGRYEQALKQFQRALKLAFTRDDSVAAIDARYNIAASLSEMDRNAEAHRSLQLALAEAQRENTAVPVDLQLLLATVRFRQGYFDEARQLAAALLDNRSASAAHKAQAQFLSGLVAARDNDAEALSTALTALQGAATDKRLMAQKMELQGHQFALRGQSNDAVEQLGAAAQLRSDSGHYRATSRILAAAAQAAERANQTPAAARFYLRAGRSAAAQGEDTRAIEWLRSAIRHGDQAVMLEAQILLDQALVDQSLREQALIEAGKT